MMIMKMSQKFFDQRQSNLGALNGLIEEMYSGYQVIKMSLAKKKVIEQFDEGNEKLYKTDYMSQFISGIMAPMMNIIGNVAIMVVIVVGAPGQYVMGTIGSLYVALSIQTTSAAGSIAVWALALLVGTICGALWGIIPGLLKAFFNINEVIVCIMTNWIAANLSSWFFKYQLDIQTKETTKGGFLAKPEINHTPKLFFDKLFPGSMLDAGIIIAIIAAIVIYIILNKTTFGFELKSCGSNKEAARYAGLNEKRNIVLSIAIAGALAGMGASLYYLNPAIEYKFVSAYSGLPAYGFNGIASAFLANCNPIGVIFSSLFIRFLNIGGDYLVKVGFNRYVADIVIAVIIYMAGFSRIIREFLNGRLSKKKPEKDIRDTVVTSTKEETK